MKNIIIEILKCSGRLDLVKEIICGLVVGYEKKRNRKQYREIKRQKIWNIG